MIDYLTTMTEPEMDAAYKQNFQNALDENGLDAYSPDFRPIRHKLSENFRQAWIAWFDGRTDEAKREQRAYRAALARDAFENNYGVSDKAPAKVKSSGSGSVAPVSGSRSGAGADTTTTTSPAATGATGATTTTSPRTTTTTTTTGAHRRPTDPTDQPDLFGDADDVNRAVKSLFGSNMEEM